MLHSKPFSGTSVFISRNLVPPELFDTIHDALKQNGAEVFLCCDPSRSGPNDFHVISSSEHEKFEDLKAKGCKMIGPQCVLSCAKEHRAFPTEDFTCCLAMDGVKLLISGFEAGEKEKIKTLVTAMRGSIHSRASSDVNFVVAKNVLAAKYKWALNIAKKPIVSINWIDQCWNEHRVVPQEPYRVLPFSGLMICVTGIPAGERKNMEKLILQNGGKYSAELTKKCTHLISKAPDGDKYKVARRWGHICIVTRKWFDQSIARRACLSEESYPVQGSPLSTRNAAKTSMSSQRSQDTTMRVSDSAFSSPVVDSYKHVFPVSNRDRDLEATLSLNLSSKAQNSSIFSKEDNGMLSEQHMDELKFEGCVADDSQSEDNDLYLSECRILLVGFDAPELRKLVSAVRSGGGSRYLSINDKLTHVVVGKPSEIEKRDLRSLASSGVIKIVRATWLEDCDRLKKEIHVLQRHNARDELLPRGAASGNSGQRYIDNSKASCASGNPVRDDLRSTSAMPLETLIRGSCEANKSFDNPIETRIDIRKRSQVSPADEDSEAPQKELPNSKDQSQQARINSSVFKGKTFCFSCSFPEERRPEILQWVNEGGGVMVDDKADFTVECHGVLQKSTSVTGTVVSTHWVRSCLQDGQLFDVGSHILYSPLPCDIPLREFESFRFCVSQYDEKERLLLKNIFFTVGAKYSEKLTRKVTHLVCKFNSGAKYEAACRWGIQAVTFEWISECIQKNKAVPTDTFSPKEASTQDLETGLVSQYPTQGFQVQSGENPSQSTSQRDDAKLPSQVTASASKRFREELVNQSCKRTRISDTRENPSQSTSQRVDDVKLPSQATASASKQFREELVNQSCKRTRLPEDSGKPPSQSTSQRLDVTKLPSQGTASISKQFREELVNQTCKRARLFDCVEKRSVSFQVHQNGTINNGNDSCGNPEIADAIEVFLEETSKIHETELPARTRFDDNTFASECQGIGQQLPEKGTSAFTLSDPELTSHARRVDPRHSANIDLNHCLKDDTCCSPVINDPVSNMSRDVNAANIYDGFSETQTESQVVGYEEDLSGRQMIIDRVLTRNSLT